MHHFKAFASCASTWMHAMQGLATKDKHKGIVSMDILGKRKTSLRTKPRHRVVSPPRRRLRQNLSRLWLLSQLDSSFRFFGGVVARALRPLQFTTL